MSEYQYFEWQTVNRLLTESEQVAVGRLSSHIEVSSSRAVVTYSWGDFKHDPRQVLVRFFDAITSYSSLYLQKRVASPPYFRHPINRSYRAMIRALAPGASCASIDMPTDSGYTYSHIILEADMRFASIAEVKNQFSRYLAQAQKSREPIVVTHHGKPYALIHAISERDLEELGWRSLAETRLQEAWVGEDDALYNYL
jgi:prevent-host-death family protein